MAKIIQERWRGWDSFVIQNSQISLRVLPQLGGKVVEIIDRERNYQWLWQDVTRPYRARIYADRFDTYDISGLDECFPNIGISSHPLLEEALLPDHGELWCQPWKVQAIDGELIGEVNGRLFSYLFRRTISLVGNEIIFSYEIHNLSEKALPSFWSAHPLFAAHNGMSIQVSGSPQMTKEFGFSSRMGQDGSDGYSGHLDIYHWPHTEGKDSVIHDLSKIDLDKPLTDKVVLRTPDDGLVRLINAEAGCALELQFNPRQLPFLGICFNLGAWPFEGNPGSWIALEPSNGGTDRLSECVELGQLTTIPAASSIAFSVCMKVFAAVS
jgi:hypothetical protein